MQIDVLVGVECLFSGSPIDFCTFLISWCKTPYEEVTCLQPHEDCVEDILEKPACIPRFINICQESGSFLPFNLEIEKKRHYYLFSVFIFLLIFFSNEKIGIYFLESWETFSYSILETCIQYVIEHGKRVLSSNLIKE